jgi:hypothetical protein
LEHPATATAAEQSAAAILLRRGAVVPLIALAAEPREEAGIGRLAGCHEKTGR